jgi:hypothetical protein
MKVVKTKTAWPSFADTSYNNNNHKSQLASSTRSGPGRTGSTVSLCSNEISSLTIRCFTLRTARVVCNYKASPLKCAPSVAVTSRLQTPQAPGGSAYNEACLYCHALATAPVQQLLHSHNDLDHLDVLRRILISLDIFARNLYKKL